MRIIAGKYKGRKLNLVGKPTTRETADMVKGAVFNMIGGQVSGVILDLFAGSGAYGLEAISRGADFCYAVDVDKDAISTIYKNVSMMALSDQFKITQSTHHDFINKLDEHVKFDYIFLDPPYALNLYEETIEKLYPHTHEDSIIICESKKDVILTDDILGFKKTKDKVYGIKRVTIYER